MEMNTSFNEHAKNQVDISDGSCHLGKGLLLEKSFVMLYIRKSCIIIINLVTWELVGGIITGKVVFYVLILPSPDENPW